MRLLWSSVIGTVKGIFQDDCHGIATQIAYHWIYALFPGLFVMVAVVTTLGANPGFLNTIGELIERATPGDTRQLVDATLGSMRHAMSRGTAPVLGLGLLGVLWVASNGFDVIMGGLNRAYRVTEYRPFWYRRLLAVVLVIAVGFGLITAFQILLVGSQLVKSWLATWPVPPDLPGLYKWARWPAYFLIATAVGLALYATAPALPHVDWRWTVPGAALFGLLWAAIGYGFDRYLSLYGHMDKLYGILGAFLVLLTWLYLTAFAFLVGGELNGQVRGQLLADPRFAARLAHAHDHGRAHRHAGGGAPVAPGGALAAGTAAGATPGQGSTTTRAEDVPASELARTK
jgi:membrane protein